MLGGPSPVSRDPLCSYNPCPIAWKLRSPPVCRFPPSKPETETHRSCPQRKSDHSASPPHDGNYGTRDTQGTAAIVAKSGLFPRAGKAAVRGDQSSHRRDAVTGRPGQAATCRSATLSARKSASPHGKNL